MKILSTILCIFLISCSTNNKRVFVNYVPYDSSNSIEKDNKIDLNNVISSHREENFDYEIEPDVDFDIENEIDHEMEQNVNDFYSGLGKRIKIDLIYSYPVKGYKITSFYGMRTHPVHGKKQFHKGIDLKGNSKIHSIKEGKVIVSKKSKTYGNIIAIRHPDDIVSLYAHNQVNYVKKGDYVKRNQVIALMGSTGYVTGKHLHFEIRNGKQNINPITFFKKKKFY